MKRLHVLLSAFACHPPTTAESDDVELQLGSGEALLGWNYIHLIRRYHRVSVLTDSRNRGGITKWEKSNPGSGIAFHYVDVVRSRRWWHNKFLLHLYYYFWQRRSRAKARRIHRTDPVDLFHHITFANDWIPSYIGAFLPVPFVWGPFGGGQKYPTGFQHEFSRRARLGEAGRLFSQWMGRHLLCARRRCLKKAGAILICNAETMNVIPPRYRDKVEFFALNGIAAEDLPPADSHPPQGGRPLRILCVARMVLVKRLDFAIRAFARFAAAHPEIPAVLDIVGEGPERSGLGRLVAEFALGDRVRFPGWMSRSEVLERMRDCDIFLFPSLREGGGFVVIEAMACAKPVLCLDAAGPGFIIQEGWGMKVKPVNPEQVVADLAGALGRLAVDAGLRDRLGRAARRRVEEFHVFDRMSERLLDVYLRALSARTKAGTS